MAAARPSPAPRTGAHAAPDPAPEAGATVEDATVETAPAAAVTGIRVPDDAAEDLSAPSDERPDIATLTAVHGPPFDAQEPPPRAVQDEDTAGEALPEAVQDPVPPPWSAARSEPADTGLEPSGDEAATDVVDTGERGTAPVSQDPGAAEPVSRAVQQAWAARAVQRARRQRDDGGPDEAQPGPVPPEDRPEPVETSEQGREHTLTVVPSASTPVPAADARDRLLSVLLADPARAVGATEDLDDARDRIEALGDVLRRRRGDLAVAVRRLHDSGLDREQIGRLAGMGCDDVATILEARTGDGVDGPRHL